ncbi:IS1/IS1595 family N-terminal zinc-binding domain-containing protein, partial [Chlorogloea sp. CCALA 695]
MNPTCTSAQIVNNGRIHNSKQRFLCRECRRQFVQQPTRKIIDAA